MLQRLRIGFLAPGVVVHEMAHHLLCRVCGVEVRQAVYFRLGTPAGFVTHVLPPLFRQNLLIALGPLLVNSALALALFAAAMRLSRVSWGAWGLVGVGLVAWLACSVGLQAWPSAGDGRNLLRASGNHLRQLNLLALLGLPIAAAILLVDWGRRLGSQWAYLAVLAYVGVRAAGP